MSVLDIKLTLDIELTLNFNHPKFNQMLMSYDIVCQLD